jgi:hypothetical protein
MKIVKEQIYEFVRYHKKINDVFKDYSRERNKLANTFNEHANKLKDKKEKLFA